jgi:His-Xaa-Ser system radical SAM maturase HxsC
MIQLKTKGIANHITAPVVAKVVDEDVNQLVCYSAELDREVYLRKDSEILENELSLTEIPFIEHLEKGDIVNIQPNGALHTIFREKSPHNALFITDRCNSNCLMCSQPPRNADDLDYFYSINTQLVRLIPPTTKELGITGGEPTLLGKRFISLLQLITQYLPDTEIHILTNGRSFAWKNIPEKLSYINNTRIVYGIPLYSDFYQQHDYVVQAKDAFNQTILGLHNMARFNQRIEIRVVLHKQTYKRLPQLARFIYMNLPFVEHIAFMGLEYTGYTPKNTDLLWMEPSEYASELEEAVEYLDRMGMRVSIYNLQLCLLKPTLWQFARKSISDWKREYLEACTKCNLLNECGGVFATSKKHSDEIKAILS